MGVSVLVPFQGGESYRKRNWAWLRRRWTQLHPEWELVEGKDERQRFSRASAINHAAEIASGDIFVIVDADVAVEPLALAAAVQSVDRGVVLPWRWRRRLSRAQTAACLLDDPGLLLRGLDANRAAGGSGNVIVSRESYETVQGFDERFRGWGSEDVAFVVSVDALVAPAKHGSDDVWHLWHPWEPDGCAARNAALLDRYLEAACNPAAMRALIEERPQTDR